MQQINENGGLFSSTGKVNYAAIGGVAGGAVGSIVPGLGTALGASLGTFLGSMVKGGVHDGKDIKKEVEKEVNRVLRFHTERSGGDEAKLLAALENAAKDKIANAEMHGANSQAKSSKQLHAARKKAFEILLKEVKKANVPVLGKTSEPGGSTQSPLGYPPSAAGAAGSSSLVGENGGFQIGGWGITPPNSNQEEKKSVLEKIKAWYQANKSKPVFKYTAWGLLGAGVIALVVFKFVPFKKKGKKIGR